MRAHAERVDAALRTARPEARRVIVLADNASPDGTAEEFARAGVEAETVALSSGTRGKGHNFRLLFEAALDVGADVLLTFDADLEVVPPDWVRALGDPVLADAGDLVTPLYARHWYDANLTNQVVAPLVAAATGVPLRQPIAGEFAFSRAALALLVALDWPPRALAFGTDVWCVLRALEHGLRVVQRPLSVGKLHSWRSDTAGEVHEEMGTKFAAIAGVTLDELVRRGDHSASDGPPRFPASPPPGRAPLEYDTSHLAEAADAAWGAAAGSEALRAVAPWAGTQAARPEVPVDAWARTLALALRAARTAGGASDELLEALQAVFLARIASVLPGLDDDGVEPMVEELTTRLHAELRAAARAAP